MAIARRDLLGISAAVALSIATSSCRAAGGRVPTGAATSPSATTSPGTVPGRSALPGQPSPGSVYYGASVPPHRSLTSWEEELGAVLSLHRSYFRPDGDEAGQLVAQCREDLAQGRLPHVSIKPAGTWRDIASGERDDWLATMLRSLGEEESAILFTLHHEPENEAGAAGMDPSDYVGMQHRAIRLAAELAPQVIVVPVLQHWTFDPMRGHGDPAAWVVPDASVFGIDIYNPWSPTNGKQWRSFGSKLDEVIGWSGERPLVIGEYGCHDDPRNPGLAAEWLRDAAAYARSHDVFSMSYFNSGRGSPEGAWELTDRAEAAFAELLTADWVARPA